MKRSVIFIKKWGLDILGFIVALWAMLPTEITKRWQAIKDAASKVTGGIARFFVGYSPIPDRPHARSCI